MAVEVQVNADVPESVPAVMPVVQELPPRQLAVDASSMTADAVAMGDHRPAGQGTFLEVGSVSTSSFF